MKISSIFSVSSVEQYDFFFVFVFLRAQNHQRENNSQEHAALLTLYAQGFLFI
jgi:hypothetical protein